MKEIQDILKNFEIAEAAGKRTAIATVVHVKGSSYRRPGARMLITEEGQLTGAISGGCLEGDALRKALFAITAQKNKLVVYDTTDEDDAKLGIQLGCNGIVYILFEPIQPENPLNVIWLLSKLLNSREDAVLTTLFSFNHQEQPGTCLLYQEGILYSGLEGETRSYFEAQAIQVLQTRSSALARHQNPEQTLDGFLQFIPPPVRLVIAGAGNDVQPLSAITAVLGWETIVVDGRPAYATSQRFPNAHRVLHARPEEVLQLVSIDPRTFFVLMTHNYNYDLALLHQLISTDCTYIGVLGPRKRLERLLNDLAGTGISLTEEQRTRLYGPVGLDLGAETAEEIALSIIAEIKAVLSGRQGTSLKYKQHPIHIN